MSRPIDPRRIALIGFGEVGQLFSKGFIASGRHDVATYDILFDDAKAAEEWRGKARSLSVEIGATAATAADGAAVVISAVTATSARAVAQEAARYLRPV